jgi:hypothetical protein
MSCVTTALLLLFVALGGLAYFIVPSINTIRARAETTTFVRTVCSSNITDVNYKSVGDYARATVISKQIGTGRPIRLWFPPFPGRSGYLIVSIDKEDTVAWITRVGVGSPTATFPCLFRPSNDTTGMMEGITEVWRSPSEAYFVAVACGCLGIISLLCAIRLVYKVIYCIINCIEKQNAEKMQKIQRIQQIQTIQKIQDAKKIENHLVKCDEFDFYIVADVGGNNPDRVENMYESIV